ncbi:hypothetical protein [Dyadobacter arcticus]|uniref:Uncharacterized protein n=1 Tax=Dyadobacter arcticus TaxID=1078754 RepID=A0ABX0UMM8_9BACT|nr:hypothetical protein [Dyadobacter arcticus]NIJ52915.1 hypothetical protein [Dyadobacter arcticus]
MLEYENKFTINSFGVRDDDQSLANPCGLAFESGGALEDFWEVERDGAGEGLFDS